MAKNVPMRKDLLGQRFDRLLVISFDRIDHNRAARWWCKCDCGRVISTIGNSLLRRLTKSCGCLKFENLVKSHRFANPPINKKHGQTSRKGSTKEYRAWISMLARCRNPKASGYRNYGGRGIKYCERWGAFPAFFADVGKAPTAKHSLDRFPDPNGNYEPGNVRWATRKQQNRNHRANRMITFNGETLTLIDWAERMSLKRHVLAYRLNHKWPLKKALTQPTCQYTKRRNKAGD